MNLQNVPCVANQQLSDVQDVKQSGTVKGICYFLNYACGAKIVVLLVDLPVALGHHGYHQNCIARIIVWYRRNSELK